MTDEKMFIFLGVEDWSGVSGIVDIGIYSVVSLGVIGLVENLVPTHGITDAVTSVLHGIFSLGSVIYGLN